MTDYLALAVALSKLDNVEARLIRASRALEDPFGGDDGTNGDLAASLAEVREAKTLLAKAGQ